MVRTRLASANTDPDRDDRRETRAEPHPLAEHQLQHRVTHPRREKPAHERSHQRGGSDRLPQPSQHVVPTGLDEQREATGQWGHQPDRRACTAPGTAPARRTVPSPRPARHPPPRAARARRSARPARAAGRPTPRDEAPAGRWLAGCRSSAARSADGRQPRSRGTRPPGASRSSPGVRRRSPVRITARRTQRSPFSSDQPDADRAEPAPAAERPADDVPGHRADAHGDDQQRERRRRPGRTAGPAPARRPRPATTETPVTRAATRGSPRRTAASPAAVAAVRVIQCWSGNVKAAAAKPHHAHSTATGAAGSAPSARVTSAKKT